MSPSWAQAVTEIAAAAGGLAVWFRRQGARQGSTDALLAQLTADSADLKKAIVQLTALTAALDSRVALLEGSAGR